MCNKNAADNNVPEPTLLALAPSLDALALEINRLILQLARLYEQRHFELQQKYGAESFLDFEKKQRHFDKPSTPRNYERPPARDPSQSNAELDSQQESSADSDGNRTRVES